MVEDRKKSIKDSVKSEAKTFLSEVKKFSLEAEELALRGGEKIVQVSQIGKLKGEIIILNQRRKQKLTELGEKLIQSKKKSSIKDPKVLNVMEEIKEIEAKRKACEEQVENLKNRYQSTK